MLGEEDENEDREAKVVSVFKVGYWRKRKSQRDAQDDQYSLGSKHTSNAIDLLNPPPGRNPKKLTKQVSRDDDLIQISAPQAGIISPRAKVVGAGIRRSITARNMYERLQEKAKKEE